MTLNASSGLPAPPILTPPAGWLGFLGMKSGGSQPGQVSGYLQTMMEMLMFYQAGARTRIVAPGAGVPIAQNATAFFGTVPAGKAWIVEAVTSLLTPGAVAPSFGFILVNGASGSAYRRSAPETLTTNVQSIMLLQGPFVMVAGDSVGFYCGSAAAPTATNVFGSVTGFEVMA